MSTDQPVGTIQPQPVTHRSPDIGEIITNGHDIQNHSESEVGPTNAECPSEVDMLANHVDRIMTNFPIRVPGTYTPDWIPDQEADSCMACESLFTLLKRRHHCRSCGKIFCGDCCKLKAKLLYMDNKEARVCNNCFEIIEFTLLEPGVASNNNYPSSDTNTVRLGSENNNIGSSSESLARQDDTQPSTVTRPILAKVHGVLKSADSSTRPSGSCNTSTTSSDQHQNKQVIFADGIRPGTDLSEPGPIASSSTSGSPMIGTLQSLLTRQLRRSDSGSSTSSSNGSKRSKGGRFGDNTIKNITVCDELGYLPPIVISRDAPIMNPHKMVSVSTEEGSSSASSALTDLILSQFKLSKTSVQASMESRSCPLNGIVKFEDISHPVGLDGVVTFLLLKDFELKVKIVKKDCCTNIKNNKPDSQAIQLNETVDEQDNTRCMSLHDETHGQLNTESTSPMLNDTQDYWCFMSDGLERLGQDEVLLIIDKDKDDPCIPRDVFKIYLTLHELALRRQALEHLGNLLFQDGLFGHKDTAGLLLIRPPEGCCLKNLETPKDGRSFLVALLLQRWEVPWSKIFPMRLLLRLGHKYDVYPYPVVSFRGRDPVYYEIGHTIISILGDFRNFRYSLTHVDGLKVVLNKASRKVLIQLAQSNYQQFNKVLDSANNEHVLAWSSCPFPEADGHLVCVQNDDGQYETVEFYNGKSTKKKEVSFNNLESRGELGASFIVFSGALKVNLTGQPAKISIVEDGLLIQIQSCTLTALKNAIHFMHNFDIDCENNHDVLNRVEIDWQADRT